MENVRRVSRAGSRFALLMLVAALILGILLTSMSAVQLAQVRRFSRELLVIRARQAAVSFFMRYMRSPHEQQGGKDRVPSILDDVALGDADFMQVMGSDGEVMGSYRGEGIQPISARQTQRACEKNLARLRRDLPWNRKGRLKVRKNMLAAVLRPVRAEFTKVDGRAVLDVLFAFPVPDRPPPPPPDETGQWMKRGKNLTLDRASLLAPGRPCVVVRVGIDARAQRSTVLTHVWILVLSILTTLLVMGINIHLYRALKQRERMAEAVQRARRVQSLGEMAATLAHEIKTPVGAIRGYAQLLQESWEENRPGSDGAGADEERLDRALGTIVRESTRLEELVQRTLEFTRPGELGLERRDLRQVADEACNLLASRASQRDVSIVTDHAPTEVMARVDADRLEQVVANLLDNAIAASDEGSTVVVRTRLQARDAIIEVTDRGKGIADQRLDDIFQPFHTDRTDGTGLGLSISRTIVEAHRGTLTASSQGEGRGATFTVAIPV